ncbi:MAG TPA: MBL fold metallo-hydrolase [Candidatus Eisenbacteria bacterium]
MTLPLTLCFQGAARTVTGSRHLISFGERRWLFDCGLYQGHRDEADCVNRNFAFRPEELDAVVVSHAHLDHTGNLPTLVAQGYRGPIHATEASAQLSRFMLADSAFLQERDVEHVNRHAAGKPARRPLYAMADVEHTVSRFAVHRYHEPWSLFEGVEVRYFDAGHILGSALTTFEFKHGGRRLRLGMSGDLGRPDRPILRDPEVHPGVEVLVLESTYGDRLHTPAEATERALVEIVQRTVGRGGRLLVPAFAVGRTQELLATLHELSERGQIPDLPIYVDSPMAQEATGVFVRHPECFDEETRRSFGQEQGAPFGFRRLRYVATADESRALNDLDRPCIILAASGMCEGGRIVHHLQHGLGNARNTVMFVGFQAQGTLGRRLRDGAERVNLFGEPMRVRAEIQALDGFSAHADQGELVAWVARLDPAPRRIFLVHGEPGPAEALAHVLETRLGAEVRVPERGEEVALWS